MNRTNSTTILVAITLGIFLTFSTTITIIPILEVNAEPKGYENEETESYLLERDNGYPQMMDDYYTEGLPTTVEEYNPDRYGGYYDHYESEFYLDQYNDGNPYGNDGNPYENDSPYEIK
jgi:hypothetical protein